MGGPPAAFGGIAECAKDNRGSFDSLPLRFAPRPVAQDDTVFIEGTGWLTGNGDVAGWFIFGRAFGGDDAGSQGNRMKGGEG